jgi:hypothetical protein
VPGPMTGEGPEFWKHVSLDSLCETAQRLVNPPPNDRPIDPSSPKPVVLNFWEDSDRVGFSVGEGHFMIVHYMDKKVFQSHFIDDLRAAVALASFCTALGRSDLLANLLAKFGVREAPKKSVWEWLRKPAV